MRTVMKVPVLLNSYLLRDDFAGVLSAGNVGGTAATPGPGTRSVPADTNNTVTLSGGNLVLNGTAASNYVDPRFNYNESFARVPGMLLIYQGTFAAGRNATIRWSNVAAFGRSTSFGYSVVFGSINAALGTTDVAVADLVAASSYMFAVAVRTNGYQFFRRSAGTWSLDYIFGTGADTPLFVAGAGVSLMDSTHSTIRVIDARFLSTPLVSDGAFGSTTDGAGHAETSGIGAGGSGKAWVDNKGTWSGGSASALSGGEAIRTVDAGSADVFADLDITRTGGNASLVLRYTDDDNYLRIGTDATSAILVEKVAGVENTLSTTAITYGAGNTMRIWINAQAARIYYNNLFVVAEASVNAALTGTRVGMYTTDTGNSFDNIVVNRSTGYTDLEQHVS